LRERGRKKLWKGDINFLASRTTNAERRKKKKIRKTLVGLDERRKK